MPAAPRAPHPTIAERADMIGFFRLLDARAAEGDFPLTRAEFYRGWVDCRQASALHAEVGGIGAGPTSIVADARMSQPSRDAYFQPGPPLWLLNDPWGNGMGGHLKAEILSAAPSGRSDRSDMPPVPPRSFRQRLSALFRPRPALPEVIELGPETRITSRRTLLTYLRDQGWEIWRFSDGSVAVRDLGDRRLKLDVRAGASTYGFSADLYAALSRPDYDDVMHAVMPDPFEKRMVPAVLGGTDFLLPPQPEIDGPRDIDPLVARAVAWAKAQDPVAQILRQAAPPTPHALPTAPKSSAPLRLTGTLRHV
ncbi:hypothetical protein GCM10011360_41830 [Primorskyibacter flagellatus]|uniref:Uncharacterized protein n=1 Tax=Primorskyibacter flagellatus TaxID=1387277 RepID=A0A917AG10_9RHOB|nr:hypothetical protein [Primorskyibacter flagellatus]GGE50389.1 hypothetical protein GCM10011360_41830 [Primorskyibacter flagellatus]